MNHAELSRDDRKRRVLAVVAAARRLADPRDPLGIEARLALPGATGLSARSIEMSLGRHLETSTTPEDLEKLVTRAGSAPRVHVVLSANVFTGVIRAVALAVAAAPSVVVRPSSREAVLAPLLLQALTEGGEGTKFELSSALQPLPGDDVHVYGRRETIAAIAASCPAGVSVRGHGPGFGVAVVGGAPGDVRDQAERLSWDVVAFDQRGCLSPRVAFVAGSLDEAARFADCLAGELETREEEVPRGTLSDEERRDASLYRETLTAVASHREGRSFAVGLDAEPRALVVPPPGRHLHIVRVSDAGELEQLLRPYRGAITCVGVSDPSTHGVHLAALAPGARILLLGEMQRPPLDGPVDLREML
jgi:hypothetical protein